MFFEPLQYFIYVTHMGEIFFYKPLQYIFYNTHFGDKSFIEPLQYILYATSKDATLSLSTLYSHGREIVFQTLEYILYATHIGGTLFFDPLQYIRFCAYHRVIVFRPKTIHLLCYSYGREIVFRFSKHYSTFSM